MLEIKYDLENVQYYKQENVSLTLELREYIIILVLHNPNSNRTLTLKTLREVENQDLN